MSSGSRPTHPRPLQGLLVVALAGIFWTLTGWIYHGPFVSRARRVDAPSGCTYQVFRAGVCQGTLFTPDPLTIKEIVEQTGCRPDCPGTSDTGEIPCDRAVKLHPGPPCVTVEPIRGGNLLIAGRRIDLNRADHRDLCAVPGIGKRLAEAIISYRETHGPFSSLDELTRIPGIGTVKLSAIARCVRVEQRPHE